MSGPQWTIRAGGDAIMAIVSTLSRIVELCTMLCKNVQISFVQVQVWEKLIIARSPLFLQIWDSIDNGTMSLQKMRQSELEEQ